MKLRLALLVTLLLLLSAPGAFAMMYGTPASSLEDGGLSVGFGYGAQSYDVKKSDNMQIHQNLGYVQVKAGLGGGWEIYARGGAGDMNIERVGTEELRGSVQPFAGGGINGRVFDGEVLDISLFGQGNYYTFEDFEDDDTATVLTLSRFWDASGGVAFTLTIEGAELYAGPYFYAWEAELDINGTLYELQNDHQLGAMFGVSWPLSSGWELDVEGQLADKYVFGAALNYPF